MAPKPAAILVEQQQIGERATDIHAKAVGHATGALF
jgi:hypothetical protein